GYEKLAQAKEGPSNQHLASGEAFSNGKGDYDMFADEDDNSKPSTDENNAVSQSSSDAINSGIEGDSKLAKVEGLYPFLLMNYVTKKCCFKLVLTSMFDGRGTIITAFCAIIMIQILGFIAL
ncbi:hypothetical protein V8G54_018319, partial [Vigna mungo]